MDGEEKTCSDCEGPGTMDVNIFWWLWIHCKKRTCVKIGPCWVGQGSLLRMEPMKSVWERSLHTCYRNYTCNLRGWLRSQLHQDSWIPNCTWNCTGTTGGCKLLRLFNKINYNKLFIFQWLIPVVHLIIFPHIAWCLMKFNSKVNCWADSSCSFA